MTSPDPVAALAAQLENLRGQLARTQGETGVLRAQLKAESSRTALLRLEVTQPRAELAEAIGTRKPKPPPAPWRGVDAGQGAAMAAGLRRRVDGFLARHYPVCLTRLPSCWRRATIGC